MHTVSLILSDQHNSITVGLCVLVVGMSQADSELTVLVVTGFIKVIKPGDDPSTVAEILFLPISIKRRAS